MSDERFQILDGFRAEDGDERVQRTVHWDGDVLTVTVRRVGHEWVSNYEEAHFRLVPVTQQWVEVES